MNTRNVKIILIVETGLLMKHVTIHKSLQISWYGFTILLLLLFI